MRADTPPFRPVSRAVARGRMAVADAPTRAVGRVEARRVLEHRDRPRRRRRSGPAQRNLDVVGGLREAEPLVRRDRRCVVRADVERDRVDPVVEEDAAEMRRTRRWRDRGHAPPAGSRRCRGPPRATPATRRGRRQRTRDRRSRGSRRTAVSRASAARTRCRGTPARRTRGPRRDRPGRAAPRRRDVRRAGTGRRAPACDAPPAATSVRSARSAPTSSAVMWA